jgi:hypothetical protein
MAPHMWQQDSTVEIAPEVPSMDAPRPAHSTKLKKNLHQSQEHTLPPLRIKVPHGSGHGMLLYTKSRTQGDIRTHPYFSHLSKACLVTRRGPNCHQQTRMHNTRVEFPGLVGSSFWTHLGATATAGCSWYQLLGQLQPDLVAVSCSQLGLTATAAKPHTDIHLSPSPLTLTPSPSPPHPHPSPHPLTLTPSPSPPHPHPLTLTPHPHPLTLTPSPPPSPSPLLIPSPFSLGV